MKKPLIIVVLILAAGIAFQGAEFGQDVSRPDASVLSGATGNSALARAFETRARNLQVEGAGKVVRILPDDNDGSRHQRFILALESGQTLLVAHNIDLAPRIQSLRVGDTVAFYGEYEWNEQGGVIHWTHHDPQGEHVAGWLRHKGKVYQ